jgi:hypothetical protein
MRITRRQLRRIIKEEKRKILSEADMQVSSGVYEGVWTMLEDDAMYSELDLQDGGAVMGIIDGLEKVIRELKDDLRGPTR